MTQIQKISVDLVHRHWSTLSWKHGPMDGDKSLGVTEYRGRAPDGWTISLATDSEKKGRSWCCGNVLFITRTVEIPDSEALALLALIPGAT